MKDYILLNRDITKHWIWNDKLTAKWWINLLLIASKEGHIPTSVKALSMLWNTSTTRVTRFLKLLENDCMIVRKTSAISKKDFIITICNYDKYLPKTIQK